MFGFAAGITGRLGDAVTVNAGTILGAKIRIRMVGSAGKIFSAFLAAIAVRAGIATNYATTRLVKPIFGAIAIRKRRDFGRSDRLYIVF